MEIKEISVGLGKKLSKDYNSWELRLAVTATIEPGEDYLAKMDELKLQLKEKISQGLQLAGNEKRRAAAA